MQDKHSFQRPGFVPVITSLLDDDLYKFTMWQVMLHQSPQATGVTEFRCRNTPKYPLSLLKQDVEEQLDWLCSLSFTQAEIEGFFAQRSYFKQDFLEFLALFRFQRKFIRVMTVGDRLVIRAEGPLVHITGFEIHVLSIVNELYFRQFPQEEALAEGRRRLAEKIALLKSFAGNAENLRRHAFEFFDFGTRRRFSKAWHAELVATLAREVPEFFKGTSNCLLALQLRLPALGTMAHEHLQKHQGLGNVQLRYATKAALEEWSQEYRGDLGIALTDVITMDAFLRDFDLYFAKLFDGLRHDSGDPFVWGRKALAHYAKLRIDAHSKRLVFSDGLDLHRCFAIYQEFANDIQTGFGIGTWLTNDVGLAALNIVMKLILVNGQTVAKVSDEPGKSFSEDLTFLRYLCSVNGVDGSWVDKLEGNNTEQALAA
ncbi:nicotinate phosphoribosyltransferase [Ottowia sp.]|uniref:nicotinate phosphoribosyltransferase n=1 Tax=Ottowia sp. TaxID=1898956 RepID=UPI0025D15391|nr:nicotinate phosphoribosyltransferase [Ottowia sp.]MBK6616423.1 nicotinate phosphoribosyltransferase [Ottowia sp.]